MDMRETIESGLSALGIGFEKREIDMLLLHIGELERWNARWNLVRASGTELVVKHTLDSLAGLPVILELDPRASIVDIGSGAGFPGIPIAIFLQESRFTLVERSSKRATFLKNAAILLGLKNTEVRSEDYAALRSRFDIVTFRAVTEISREIENLAAIMSPSGKIVAYKGKLDKSALEAEDLGILGYKAKVIPVAVPFLDEERCLVVVERKGA